MKNRFIRNWVFLISSVFAFLVIPFFLNTETAYAVDYAKPGEGFNLEGEWIDRATIKITKFEFTDDSKLVPSADRDSRDDINKKLAEKIVGKEIKADNISADEGDSGAFFLDTGCGSKTKFYTFQEDREPNGMMKNNTVRLHGNDLWLQGSTRPCYNPIAKAGGVFNEDRILEFYPANFDSAKIWYTQKDGTSGTLSRVDNNADEEVQMDATNNKIYRGKDVGGNCTIFVTFIGEPTNGDRNVADYKTCGGSATELKGIFVRVKNAEEVKKAPPPDGVSPTGEPPAECEVIYNPLTWLMCPLITAGIGAVQTLDNAITSQLNFDTKKSDSLLNENSPGGKALFNAWASFRYISLGLLLVIGLVMIMSQALSFGVFDAYTIKKILPKMLIGIIGVSVSWYLCKFAIEIANDLGLGVRSLLYGPFKTLGPAQFNQGVSSLLTVGAGIAVLGLGILGILSFIVTALMAVMIAFAILIFRRILIILLVVTAPVAIICWILPNTQRVWKMWWDFFSRALIVFPIISLFIAGGRVVAAVATTTSNGTKAGFTESAIAFIAYFGPYFALPAAFRLAGGAIATIGGIANNKTTGAFDRLKNFRGERRKNRVESFRNAGLYNENTRRGRIGNKLGGWAFDADERLPFYAGARGGKFNPFRNQSMVIGSKIEHAQKEQTTEMYKKWNNDGDANDKFFAAMGGSLSDLSKPTAARFRAATGKDGKNLNLESGLDTREKFEAAMQIMQQSDDSTERLAANALSRNMASVVNKTRDGNGYASIHGASMLGLSTHGFGSEESMVELSDKIKAENGGHSDFAEGMLVFSEVNGTSGRKAGYSHSIDKNGNTITGKQAGRDWARASSKSAPDIARLKKRQAVEDTQALVGILQYAKTDDAGRAALRQKWAAEGLDDVAIRNKTDGYFSDAAVMDPNATEAQREAAAGAKDAFLDKARTADQTLFALTQSYTGGATDTVGAISKVIEDNAGIIGQVGSTLSAAEKAALQNRGGGGGGSGLGGANLGGGGLGGGGVGGGGL